MLYLVLIVAKCNVNSVKSIRNVFPSDVLIVAKCNVNYCLQLFSNAPNQVLIVAKCNVNKKLLIPNKPLQLY